MYGLNVGRYHHFPEIKTRGMQALPNICLFTSELVSDPRNIKKKLFPSFLKQSHYSIKKGVAWMGMGLDCVKTVPCDTRGRMIPKKLEEMVIQSKEEVTLNSLDHSSSDSTFQGFTPFLVNATSGTTVAGAFDPLDAIADIAEKHNLWMHVDACWGGGLLFSDQQRHKLNGVHRLVQPRSWVFVSFYSLTDLILLLGTLTNCWEHRYSVVCLLLNIRFVELFLSIHFMYSHKQNQDLQFCSVFISGNILFLFLYKHDFCIMRYMRNALAFACLPES